MPILCRHCQAKTNQIYGTMRKDKYNVVHLFDHEDFGEPTLNECPQGTCRHFKEEDQTEEPNVLPGDQEKSKS